MTYTFDIDIAQRFGVDEAIMIQNLVFWIHKNEANDKYFYDGRYWTYNSAEAFTQLFPFWTVHHIRRLLSKLVEQGVLVKGNYNASQYDRTAWYGFNDLYLQNCKIHLAKLQNGTCETAKPIQDSNTDINTDKNIIEYRGTTENLCLFANSRFASFEAFQAQFQKPEYEQIDIYYYWRAIADWSAQGGKKKRDWIATARNFMRGDNEKGRLHRTGGVALSPDAIRYLEMGNKLFDD